MIKELCCVLKQHRPRTVVFEYLCCLLNLYLDARWWPCPSAVLTLPWKSRHQIQQRISSEDIRMVIIPSACDVGKSNKSVSSIPVLSRPHPDLLGHGLDAEPQASLRHTRSQIIQRSVSQPHLAREAFLSASFFAQVDRTELPLTYKEQQYNRSPAPLQKSRKKPSGFSTVIMKTQKHVKNKRQEPI